MAKRAGGKDYRGCEGEDVKPFLTTVVFPRYAAHTRGFAFVAFKKEGDAKRMLNQKHWINKKEVRQGLLSKGNDNNSLMARGRSKATSRWVAGE